MQRDLPETLEVWKRLDEAHAEEVRQAKQKDPNARLAFNNDAREDKPESVVIWNELHRMCGHRRTLPMLCRDVVACVMPDGPHHAEVSFNSSHRSADDIAQALCSVAHSGGITCSVIPNVHDEYRLLLRISPR